MANKSEKSRLKDKILQLLIDNEDMIEMLAVDMTKIKKRSELIYKYIFPYFFVPGAQETAKSFISFKVDCPHIEKNEYFKNATITLYSIAHRDFLDTDYGVRVDVIGDIILDIFSWNTNLGFELKLKSDREINLTPDFYCRELVFGNLTFNSLVCGIKDEYEK